jgi:multiple sugar transport system permease protein/raffinose/stachyose/melibiose transport system permease protein
VPFARFFRTVWFTPVLMSYPVVGVIWLWVYNYDWGIANLVLRAVGLGRVRAGLAGQPGDRAARADPRHHVDVRRLQHGGAAGGHPRDPADYLEAAHRRRRRGWQRTLRIMVPLLRPTIVNLVILDFIGKMKQFALVWVMTRGGPCGARRRWRRTWSSARSSGRRWTSATPPPSPSSGS